MDSEGTDLPLIACANEIKSPLILMRQLSLELENTIDSKRRAEICKQMRLTAERSLRLADNLAKIAHLEGALFDLEPVHVAGLCREIINEFEPLTEIMSQNISTRFARKTVVCVGNRDLLKSLLIGLLDNALQYTKKNGQIYITTRINHGNIELAVRDNGPIIELSNFRKLKDNIGKYNQSILARPLSSGLGIAIVEKMTSAMNGELSISRHHSGGITFKVLLPTSQQLSILEL
jgi:two-component system sensor histidine kinase TctE